MSNTKTAQIKLATLADVTSISVLGKTTFVQTFGHCFRDPMDLEEYLVRTFSEEKIRSSIANPNNHFWIAFVNALPVGYAKLKLQSPSQFIPAGQVGQLQKIYVLKEYLSHKIGFALQNHLIAAAAEHGVKSLWLSVLKSNERAINFYTKTGFIFLGRHDFTIGKERFEFIAMSLSVDK